MTRRIVLLVLVLCAGVSVRAQISFERLLRAV